MGAVLLTLAFLYDIFWVFISKKLFHESVMIVVSNLYSASVKVFADCTQQLKVIMLYGGYILILDIYTFIGSSW